MSAADGLLINGSVNNGGASPFAQSGAFGNNRRGPQSLYNWGLGGQFGNSALDARPYSFAGRPTPKPAYSDIQIMGTFGGPRQDSRTAAKRVRSCIWATSGSTTTTPRRSRRSCRRSTSAGATSPRRRLR